MSCTEYCLRVGWWYRLFVWELQRHQAVKPPVLKKNRLPRPSTSHYFRSTMLVSQRLDIPLSIYYFIQWMLNSYCRKSRNRRLHSTRRYWLQKTQGRSRYLSFINKNHCTYGESLSCRPRRNVHHAALPMNTIYRPQMVKTAMRWTWIRSPFPCNAIWTRISWMTTNCKPRSHVREGQRSRRRSFRPKKSRKKVSHCLCVYIFHRFRYSFLTSISFSGRGKGARRRRCRERNEDRG